MAETTAATWLTQEAYDRLKAEYEHLIGPGRTEIATRIAQARDEGDLKENSGYHAAREEQAKQEARIRELKAKLENAQIGTSKMPVASASALPLVISGMMRVSQTSQGRWLSQDSPSTQRKNSS